MQITPAHGLGWSPDRRGGAVGSEDLHPDLPFGRCITVLLLIPSKATLSKGYENVARGRRHIVRTALRRAHGRAAPATRGAHHGLLRWRCASREESRVSISDGHLPCYSLRTRSLRTRLPYLPG